MSIRAPHTNLAKLGLDTLRDPKDATVDIVAVHGLGANPEKSWLYEKEGYKRFNWLIDDDGLAKDFPTARIMLFAYGSAYKGRFKMKQYIINLAAELLDALNLRREEGKCPRRPLVMLGHSMGGLVIAKALCLAESERIRYPDMYESITGCLFFGTPFNGAPVAEVAEAWAKAKEKTGVAINSQLLTLLTPGNDSLRELKRAFVHSIAKLSQKVEIHCFFEESRTDWDQIVAKLAGQDFSPEMLLKLGSEESREFVSRDSASLDSSMETGLHRTHRDLVRFESFKDPQYQRVRGPLKRIVHSAPRLARSRFNCTRETAIDAQTWSRVLENLSGPDVQRVYATLSQRLTTRSWLLDDSLWQEWSNSNQGDRLYDSYLYIYGPKGKGKTHACVATVRSIKSAIRKAEDDDSDSAHRPNLLAYYFCNQTPDHTSAEDVLRSLLQQLCQQQTVLATYAKQFLKDPKSEPGRVVHQSVEHLWQCLRDMLTDSTIGTISFVINNLHELPDPDTNELTKKLLAFISNDVQRVAQPKAKRVSTRWLFTSRDRKSIQRYLVPHSAMHCIDLEDEKYGKSLRSELKQHARAQVDELQKEKGYTNAITYFAESVIGTRAEDTKWIDVAVVRLAALPPGTRDGQIRGMLERAPQDFTTLLNDAWASILRPNVDDMDSIKELLRALILAYRDPTESELLILIGSSPNNEEHRFQLQRMVDKCNPLLIQLKRGDETSIGFVNADVKNHLFNNSGHLLDLPKDEHELQHGFLALRCFDHVLERLSCPPQERDVATELQQAQDKDRQEVQPETEGNHDSANQSEQEGMGSDSESNAFDTDAAYEVEDQGEFLALPYATTHWLGHASLANANVTRRLSQERTFWKPESQIMARWLGEYERLTQTFAAHYITEEKLNALHVAATLGYPQLVQSLLDEGHQKDIYEYDSLQNQPLHLAANFGQTEIIEQLLDAGAEVDESGPERQNATPLSMAALSGSVQAMLKLVAHGADKDTIDTSIGPVINAAIFSGNSTAVTELINMGAKLNYPEWDYEDGSDAEGYATDESDADSEGPSWLPPLALAAQISDISMFSAILEAAEDNLTADEHVKALRMASFSGRIEVVEKLLEYQHAPEAFQTCLEIATSEQNWDVVRLMFDKSEGLDCEETFKAASTDKEDLEDILEICWEHSNGSLAQEVLDDCLYTATDLEKKGTVDKLLEFGASCTALGEEFGNALTASAYDGTVPIAKALLEHGADINAPEGFALHAAAAQGHLEMVQLLVERGVSIDFVYETGTALQVACDNDNFEIVCFLLDNGADPNLGGGKFDRSIFSAIFQGHIELLARLLQCSNLELEISGGPGDSTPIHYAALHLPVKAVAMLIKQGAPVNLVDSDGDTALMAAAMSGDADVIKILLEHGADILVVNCVGLSALDIAAQLGRTQCVQLLAARACTILRHLKMAANEGNETAQSLIDSEMQSRSESMAQPNTFHDIEEFLQFHQVEEANDICHSTSSESCEGPSDRAREEYGDEDGNEEDGSENRHDGVAIELGEDARVGDEIGDEVGSVFSNGADRDIGDGTVDDGSYEVGKDVRDEVREDVGNDVGDAFSVGAGDDAGYRIVNGVSYGVDEDVGYGADEDIGDGVDGGLNYRADENVAYGVDDGLDYGEDEDVSYAADGGLGYGGDEGASYGVCGGFSDGEYSN